MSIVSQSTEVEIRALYGGTLADFRRTMRRGGLQPKPIIKQVDYIYDLPDGSLFRSGRKIRVRQEGDNVELTYKGDLTQDQLVSKRVELNVSIAPEDIDAIGCILTTKIG